MSYVKIIYQNSPSTATPINAENLNHMDDQIALNDQRLTEIETSYVKSFNGRKGEVVPESGDYSAEQITYDNTTSGLTADDVQEAIDELATEKADSSTTLAGYGITDAYTKAETDAEIANIDTFTASGESFALTPTSEGSVLAHTLYGMSVQDGIPTPSSPVDIVSSKADFRCVGKNLIPYPYDSNSYSQRDIDFTCLSDGTINANGTNNGTGNSTYNFVSFTLSKGSYVINGCPIQIGNNYRCGVARVSDSVTLAADFGSGANFTLDANTKVRVFVQVFNGKTANNIIFKPMIYLATVEDSTYEPHKHTDITTDLTLRAIEVTSSDNYNLVRDGKYYIADSVDWDEDRGYEITRRVKEITIDENNTSDWYEASTAVYDQITYSLDTITSNVTLMCNQMPNAASWTPNNCFVRSSNHFAHFLFDANKFGSKENAITYFTNNPLIFTYVKDTPTTEPLTFEQAQSFLSLKTYDVSTSINAQSSPEPTVELEYAKSQTTALALSGHNVSRINALKIVDLNTALIELGGN